MHESERIEALESELQRILADYRVADALSNASRCLYIAVAYFEVIQVGIHRPICGGMNREREEPTPLGWDHAEFLAALVWLAARP